jgi:hypothetical protein
MPIGKLGAAQGKRKWKLRGRKQETKPKEEWGNKKRGRVEKDLERENWERMLIGFYHEQGSNLLAGALHYQTAIQVKQREIKHYTNGATQDPEKSSSGRSSNGTLVWMHSEDFLVSHNPMCLHV